MGNTEPPAQRDDYTNIWPDNLPVNKPGEGFLSGVYQMGRAWHDLDYALKRTKPRQINRVKAYASRMMGAVKV